MADPRVEKVFPTRAYRDNEEIKVGDVLAFDDQPFGTVIVTKIDDQEVHLERAHMKLTTLGKSPCIMVERFSVDAGRIRRMQKEGRFMVHTTGLRGEIDNRAY